MTYTTQEEILKAYSPHEEKHLLKGDDTSGVIFTDEQAKKTVKHILKHKKSVRKKLMFIASEITKRAVSHDDSKLQTPELEWLIQMDKEPKYQYGTPEYFDKMRRWEKFFKHHYKNNRHHPDHFSNGVSDMTIVDLCEYVSDIISYYDELHPEGAIKTIAAQAERFKLDDQLVQILKNTLLEYFTWIGEFAPKAEENAPKDN